MKIDARLDPSEPAEIREVARAAEAHGYSGLWSSETAHDPFLPLAIAAEHTTSIELGCAVAVAFARNPMTVAQVAHDLQRYSGGRFVLGLGSQVRPHIERRFSMPWSRPADRMAEFVEAVRAIIDAWESDGPLAFEGEFYRHTLMTPMFRPEPHGHGTPRIVVAAVGSAMIETAARVADGLLVHAFTTPSYLRTKIAPVIARRAVERGTDPAAFEISCRVFLVTGRDERELATAAEAVRQRIAFYASTPAYRPVLEHHGWGAVGERLTELSRSTDPGRWQAMAGLVDEEMLHTFAVVAEPDQVAERLEERYAGTASRCWFYTPYEPAPGLLDEITRSARRG